MKTARTLCGLIAVACALASTPTLAQRMQFATPVDSTSSAASPGAAAITPPASPYVAPSGAAAPPAYPAPSASPSAPAASPTFTPPAPLVTAPPVGAPVVGGPPAGAPGSIYTPSPGLGVAPAAPVPPCGTPAPPPAGWDPYAPPGNAPSALMQQDPCFQSSPAISVVAVQKFIQQINLNYDWFAGNPTATARELGINDADLNVTFAFPLFNIQTPFLVTPGFAVHYWNGPVSVLPAAPSDSAPADLPPQTYDAYLDFGWNPQISDVFGAELNFRTGVYSDFSRVTSDSIRFMGKGMAVLKLSPHMTLKAGVWYLDRVQVKILPAGGLVWTPNPDVYFDILFPNPEIGHRLTTWGNTEWWLYASGAYGGGTWTIKRDTGYMTPPAAPWQHPADGTYTRFDYNDIRIAVGLRFKTPRQLEGHFEVGFSCDRQLVYQDLLPSMYVPTNTVYVAAGLAY